MSESEQLPGRARKSSGEKQPGQPPSGEKPMPGDIYHVVLVAPNRRVAAELVAKHALDLGPLHLRPETGELEMHLYAPQRQIEELRAAGWKPEVRENMSAEGRQRQQEVARGDRFQGGKKPPRGLGKKVKE